MSVKSSRLGKLAIQNATTSLKKIEDIKFDDIKKFPKWLKNLDRIYIFNQIDSISERLWGIWAVSLLPIAMVICAYIEPQLVTGTNMAFSDFGSNIKSAPFFALSLFGSAYGLWKWRNYLFKTSSIRLLPLMFLSSTIFGLYLIALFAVAGGGIFTFLHIVGVLLMGLSVMALVLTDIFFGEYKNPSGSWRLFGAMSVVAIIAGGLVTFLSLPLINILNVTIVGEAIMLEGFTMWVVTKTILGTPKD